MPLDIFELKSRQSLAKTSGIILDRELLVVFQAIENLSSRSNLQKAMLFSPTPERISALKLSPERFREVVRDLVDFQLVAQVFELVFNQDSRRLEIVSYFLTETETLRDTSESYNIFLERSKKEVYRYCKEVSILTREKSHHIAYNLAKGNRESFGSNLKSLLSEESFILYPPSDFISRFKRDLEERLGIYKDIIGSLDTDLYFVPEDDSQEIFESFRNEWEARLIPVYIGQNESLEEKFHELESKESQIDKRVDYRGEWEYARKQASLFFEFHQLIGKASILLLETIVKLSYVAESYSQKKEKQERDRLALKYIKAMDGGEDLDSLFLCINEEDSTEMPRNVIDALKIDKEILHAEWHTASHKLVVFAMKKPQNIKKINRIIFDKYKDSTEFPLYLRVLLESNEKDVFEVFQDSEFLEIYGKNLQSVYLRYIPFFYRLFAWLGIKSLINAGYTKAKSIIKYQQMERQFLYEKRQEKIMRERIQRRLEELSQRELEKYKSYLIQALEDFYFYEKKIPSAEEISFNYPALTPMMIEKVCREHQFTVKEGEKGFMGENLIAFPANGDWTEKNREIYNLAQTIISGKSSYSSQDVLRAETLQKDLV